MKPMESILYIVATPIGNLGDITLRAIDILKSVSLILCEDTRVTRKLLSHYHIYTPVLSYHEHSGADKVSEIIQKLKSGGDMALVTDAGTPTISDPGSPLLKAVSELPEVKISPIPGPSALIAALSISGFPADSFVFMGFVPHKNGRKRFFERMREERRTVVCYESTHRIKKTIGQLSELVDPSRLVCLCRELTKKFETVYRGTIVDLAGMNVVEKGEFVIVLSAY